MKELGVIAEFARQVAVELEFNRSLSQRVCREVEDHLCEAVAADPSSDRADAERRAIARFGDPHVIGKQFAVGALIRQARSTSVIAVTTIAAVFVAMKARVAGYGVMACGTAVHTTAVADVVLMVDRVAFWLAAIVGVAGLLYSGRLRVPATLTRNCQTQLGRLSCLSLTAAAGLVAVVASDGILTILRMAAMDWCVDFVLPVLSLAAEVACAGVLVVGMRRMARNTSSVAQAASWTQ